MANFVNVVLTTLQGMKANIFCPKEVNTYSESAKKDASTSFFFIEALQTNMSVTKKDAFTVKTTKTKQERHFYHELKNKVCKFWD